MADTIFIPDLPLVSEVNDNTTFVSDSGVETNSVKAPQVADYVKNNTTPNDIGAMPSDRIIVNPNLLDNWYFGNPVNQRGQTEYSGAGYTIDRWKNNSAACKLTLEDSYIHMQKNTSSTSTATQMLEQYIENFKDYASKTITVSAIVKGTARINIGVDGAGYQNTDYVTYSDWTLITKTVSLPSGITTSLSICIQGPNGSEWYCKAIKLELGSVQTLAHQENGEWVLNEISNYVDELLCCRRYLRPLLDATASLLPAGSGSATNVYCTVPLETPLRTIPSIIGLSETVLPKIFYKMEGAYYSDISSITVYRYGDTGVVLRAICPNAPAQTITCLTKDDISVKLFLCSEL